MSFPHQNMAQQHVATSLDHHAPWENWWNLTKWTNHQPSSTLVDFGTWPCKTGAWCSFWRSSVSKVMIWPSFSVTSKASPESLVSVPFASDHQVFWEPHHATSTIRWCQCKESHAGTGTGAKIRRSMRPSFSPLNLYIYIYIFIITRVGFTTPSGTWQWTIGHLYRYFPHEHLGLTLWFSSHIWFSRGQLGRCQATLWRMASSISADSVNGCRREVLARRFPEAERGSKIQLGWGFIGNCHGDLMVVSPIYGNHGAFPSGDLT